VFVYKDFNRPPAHINTIPVESLDGVKEWLDSVDIPYTEGPLNLNWAMIMKTVTADPHQFFVDGGWTFLRTDSDDEDGSEESEESAFEMSDAELAESEASSEEESDFDDDASADEGDDDSDADDDEGEDWDELEKKAQKADMNGATEDEDRGKKRKR
jgi:nucleosome binding factor SPN SPT16 subunit